jgi:hypothetical protein
MQIRGIVVAILAGGTAGSLLTAYFGADLIHWYAQPPFPMGCDCGQAMTWAMGKLVTVGVLGWGAGALLLAIAYGAIFGKKKKEASA